MCCRRRHHRSTSSSPLAPLVSPPFCHQYHVHNLLLSRAILTPMCMCVLAVVTAAPITLFLCHIFLSVYFTYTCTRTSSTGTPERQRQTIPITTTPEFSIHIHIQSFTVPLAVRTDL